MNMNSEEFMSAIWDARNSGADTEEKLVASILRLAGDNIKSYTAQNDLIVLDRNDLLQLAEELNQ